MSNEIQPDQLGVYIGEILQTFNHSVTTMVDEVSMEVGKAGAKELQGSNNGGRWKKYPKSWTVKKEKNGTVYIHNKKDYRLTHLLEKGHKTSYKSGAYGKKTTTGAFPHIAPVEQQVIDNFTRTVTNRIKFQK